MKRENLKKANQINDALVSLEELQKDVSKFDNLWEVKFDYDKHGRNGRRQLPTSFIDADVIITLASKKIDAKIEELKKELSALE